MFLIQFVIRLCLRVYLAVFFPFKEQQPDGEKQNIYMHIISLNNYYRKQYMSCLKIAIVFCNKHVSLCVTRAL